MIKEITVLFVAFSGVILGFLLSLIAPEEIKGGLKYLHLWKKIVLVLIIIVPFFYLDFKISLFLGLIILLLYFVKKEYPLLSVIFYSSAAIEDLFILESSFIFIYGIPLGLIFSSSIKKNKLSVLKDILKEFGIFLIFGIILLII